MAAGMSKISAMFTADTSGLASGTKQASQSLRSLASDVNSLKSSMNTLVGINAAQLFGSITSGVVGAAKSFAALASDSSETIDQLSKMAARLGVSYAEMSGLSLAADLAGVSVGTLAGAMTKADRAFVEAQRGSKSATEAFARIGLSLNDLGKLDPRGRFDAIANSISSLPTAAERSAAAIALFGRSGADLLPLFQQGATGIREAQQWAEKLGLTLTDVQGRDVEAMNDSWTLVQKSIEGVVQQVVANLSPAIKGLNDAWLQFVGGIGGQQIGEYFADAILDGALVLATTVDSISIKMSDVWATGSRLAAEWGVQLQGFADVGRQLGTVKDVGVSAVALPLLGITGPLQSVAEGLQSVSRQLPGADTTAIDKSVAELKAFNRSISAPLDRLSGAIDGSNAAGRQAAEITGKAAGLGVADAVRGFIQQARDARQQPDAAVQKPEPIAAVVEPIRAAFTDGVSRLVGALDVRTKEGNKEMLRLIYGGQGNVDEQQLDVQRKLLDEMQGVHAGVDALDLMEVAPL